MLAAQLGRPSKVIRQALREFLNLFLPECSLGAELRPDRLRLKTGGAAILDLWQGDLQGSILMQKLLPFTPFWAGWRPSIRRLRLAKIGDQGGLHAIRFVALPVARPISFKARRVDDADQVLGVRQILSQVIALAPRGRQTSMHLFHLALGQPGAQWLETFRVVREFSCPGLAFPQPLNLKGVFGNIDSENSVNPVLAS